MLIVVGLFALLAGAGLLVLVVSSAYDEITSFGGMDEAGWLTYGVMGILCTLLMFVGLAMIFNPTIL